MTIPTGTPSQLLANGAAELNVNLKDAQVHLFMEYLVALKAWNEKFNLTSITDDRDIVIKHFLDSLSLFKRFTIEPASTVIDIGSGAGFPGIPLKISRPDIELTLLESSQKKASFLSYAIAELDLEGACVVSERAEDFARRKENREHFSTAVSRAVADLAVLVEYSLPLVKLGGRVISYKAKGVQDEVQRANRAIKILGGYVEEIANVVVPFLNAERYLVSVVKEAPSPQNYPRRAGIPVKKPLI